MALPLARARAELLTRYQSREGTLAWYCVEHWSRELALDIALLKREVGHLIAMASPGGRFSGSPDRTGQAAGIGH